MNFSWYTLKIGVVYWGIKHSDLIFWELWAKLPTIMWLLVMWHFEKQDLSLFGSRHQSEKTLLFCPLFLSSMCMQISLCRAFPYTRKKCKFLSYCCYSPLLVLWNSFCNLFYGLGPLWCFVIMCIIYVYKMYVIFCLNELCFYLLKYSMIGSHSDSLMHYRKKLVVVSMNTTY